MSFGTELREEREKRGVDLAAIAAGTKVLQRHLRALETDAYHELPGGVFNRGIVRGYCRHLGLDENEWLLRFGQTGGTAAGDPDWALIAQTIEARRALAGGASRRKWPGVALMVLALAGLALATWYFVLKRRVGPPPPEGPAVGMVRSGGPGRAGLVQRPGSPG